MSESRSDSGCPSSEELATYARGLLPAGSVESLTVHIAACARCEETVVELAAASAAKLVGPLQSAAVEQPFVDESECVRVVERLQRQGPFGDATPADSHAAKSPTPTEFGEYVIIDRCGSGGMGHVFRARHRRMDRVVALKVMSTAALANTEALKRFEREARAAAKLIHPNIVHAYDAGTQGGVPYLVMEYVAGCDLATLVKRDGKLDISRACDYLAQAARGLVFAHEQGIVHRDIKPGNLLVNEGEGIVKVLDLGLARFQEPSVGQALPAGELTNSGALMGTVDYMAPEQALNTSRADAKADVYSLGCTLFRVLTGENVFAGNTMMEKLVAHREQTPRRLRTLRPDVPQELDDLTAAMLAKQPSARPTMTDVAARLAQLAAALSDKLSDKPGDKRSDVAPSSLRHTNPRRRWTTLVVAASVLVAGFILWSATRERTPREPTSGLGLPGAQPVATSGAIAPVDRKDSLFVYGGEPFDPEHPMIDVESLRYDGSTPLTVEAWVVPDPTPTLAEYSFKERDFRLKPAFVEFGGSEDPQARLYWHVISLEDMNRYFVGTVKYKPQPPMSPNRPVTSSPNVGADRSARLHHLAITIGPKVDGKHEVVRWWNGVPVRFSRGMFELVFDPRDHLRSNGYVDEVRISQSVRYTAPFKPERRFEPDADTLALYHCDEGSGDVLVDASGRGHHGKLRNALWKSTAAYPIAEPRIPPENLPVPMYEFVGGSSPAEPLNWELTPLPREAHLGAKQEFYVRARNAQDKPVPLEEVNNDPTARRLGWVRCVIEFLEPGSAALANIPGMRSTVPGTAFAAMTAIQTDRFRLAPGEAETIRLLPKIESLPVGRYRFRCRIEPLGEAGRVQEASFEFRVVDNPSEKRRVDQVAWKIDGLAPFPDPQADTATPRNVVAQPSVAAQQNAVAKPNADGAPRDNLFVYSDQFDINDPIITVDAIHDDFPEGYTIEAWTVADENLSASLREHFQRFARSTAQPAFFGFDRGRGSTVMARAMWKVLGQGPTAERHFLLSNKLTPPPQDTSGRDITFSTFSLTDEAPLQPELNHIAISFGPVVDGKQSFDHWWNGAGLPNANMTPFLHDPLDVLRSHGYIDELRISKGRRYKQEFVPQRRFETDADTIALYHCDEGSGDVLIDSSGHERHGKVKNAKWASTSTYATATPRFRGATAKSMRERPPTDNLYVYGGEPFDSRQPTIEVPSLKFDPLGPMTIEAWVVPEPTPSLIEFFKRRDVPPAEAPALFEFAGSGVPQARASLTLAPMQTVDRRLRMGQKTVVKGSTPAGDRVVFADTPIFQTPTSDLRHVAICFGAETDRTRMVRHWIDGLEASFPPTLMSVAHDPRDVFRSFGYLDELRISKSVRYDKQFDPHRRFEPDADTIALYHCDEGSGEILYDSSGNHHHGRLTNAKWASTAKHKVFDWRPDLKKPIGPPKRAPSGDGKSTAGKTASAAQPGPDLYIYSEPFNQHVPAIEVDTLRYDGSTPLTVEAWIVPVHTPEMVQLPFSDNRAVTAFDFGGGEIPMIAATWPAASAKSYDIMYSIAQRLPPHLPIVDKRISAFMSMFGRGKHRELQHVAVCYGPVENGKQYVAYWFNGERPKMSRGYIKPVFDVRDHLRSSGFIDELRVSKVERYKDKFAPKRRFEPDADTLGLYHCDEGSGDVLIDSSGHDNHGRLKNAKWAPVGALPVAPPGVSDREKYHGNRKWVGGSSPKEPTVLEVEPLPAEVAAKSLFYFSVRIRNTSDKPLPLLSFDSGPLIRHVLIVSCSLEALDPTPGVLLPRIHATVEPNTYRFRDGWGLSSDRFELAPGEWEALGVDLPSDILPPGRYRVRCRIMPQGVLGREQEAAFEFRVVDKPADQLDKTPGTKVVWTSEGLKPLPALVRGAYPKAIPAPTPAATPSATPTGTPTATPKASPTASAAAGPSATAK